YFYARRFPSSAVVVTTIAESEGQATGSSQRARTAAERIPCGGRRGRGPGRPQGHRSRRGRGGERGRSGPADPGAGPERAPRLPRRRVCVCRDGSIEPDVLTKGPKRER